MKTKIIIDTDAGIDDAEAVIMALVNETVEIVAITSCSGNCSGEQAAKNMAKLLTFVNRTEIPVYVGTPCNFIGTVSKGSIYGKDGFGDMDDVMEGSYLNVASASAIVDYVNQFPNEITIVAIGPLTNLALAYLLDPTLDEKIKKLVMMGGDRSGGNWTKYAEFNIWSDPYAARLVFSKFKLKEPITLIDWNLTLRSSISTDFIPKHLTRYGEFIKKLEHTKYGFEPERLRKGRFISADPLTMFCLLYPQHIIASHRADIKEIDLTTERIGETVFTDNINGLIELIDEVDVSSFEKTMRNMNSICSQKKS